jgi:hypothetical protein
MTSYIRRLSRFEAPNRIDWLIYFTVFLIIHIPGILNFYDNDGTNNPYLFFAQSLTHGDLHLPAMSSYGDMIFYQGNYYLPYPPLPSLILLPFVAVLGPHHINTVLLALIMTCVNLFLMHRIFLRLRIKQEYFPWLMAAYFFGTGYWYALFTSHHVYAFAHITSCMFQFLLINELLGKRRWWLAGLYIGCCFFTRQFTIFYIILALGFMYYLHRQGKEKIKAIHLFSLLGTLGFFVVLDLLYNYLRFGNPLDTGYSHIIFIGVLKERVDQYGVFSIRYFLFNLYSFFIKGFNIEFQGQGMLSIKDMDLWGTSLLAASPFVIASLRAEWPRALMVATWLTIACILTGTLFYHNNGFHQVNTMRFSLDFLPLLFVLIALGIRNFPQWLFRGMVIYAVVLNLIGFLVHSIYQVK